MSPNETREQSFQAKLEGTEAGRVYVVLPFDPETDWGSRTRYHVTGTINGIRVRGALEKFSGGYFLPLGRAYRDAAGLKLGDSVRVALMPEGPQGEALEPDIVAALAAEPEALAFFDGLATFYRKKLLRWIDSTKRSPTMRAQRITELVALMKAGKKEQSR